MDKMIRQGYLSLINIFLLVWAINNPAIKRGSPIKLNGYKMLRFNLNPQQTRPMNKANKTNKDGGRSFFI